LVISYNTVLRLVVVVLTEDMQELTNNWGNTVTNVLILTYSDCCQLQSVCLVTSYAQKGIWKSKQAVFSLVSSTH